MSKINTNVSDISSNLSLINTNKSNISNNYNISQINKKKSKFNTSLIDNNRNNISSNLSKINSIEENNLKISNNVFNDKYSHSYIFFQKIFEYDFNTEGELIINTIINYKYDNLVSDINRLTHLYEFYDEKNVLFY